MQHALSGCMCMLQACSLTALPPAGMQDYVWGWRFSLGFAIIPALMFLVGAIIAPDSPNSLLLNGKEEKARRVRPFCTLSYYGTLTPMECNTSFPVDL